MLDIYTTLVYNEGRTLTIECVVLVLISLYSKANESRGRKYGAIPYIMSACIGSNKKRDIVNEVIDG